MKSAIIFLVAVALACVLGAALAPAHAQTFCGKRAMILKHLAARTAEVPIAMGLTSTGHVLELLNSPTGVWTIIVTRPNGMTCVVSAGEAWATVDTPPALPGRPL